MLRFGSCFLSLWLTVRASICTPKPVDQSEGQSSADSVPGHRDSAPGCSCPPDLNLSSRSNLAPIFYPSFDNWVFVLLLNTYLFLTSFLRGDSPWILASGQRFFCLVFVCFYWKHSPSALCKPHSIPQSLLQYTYFLFKSSFFSTWCTGVRCLLEVPTSDFIYLSMNIPSCGSIPASCRPAMDTCPKHRGTQPQPSSPGLAFSWIP